MDRENFKLVRLFKELIYDKLGIHLSDDKIHILKLKLQKLIVRNKIHDLRHFYESIIDGNHKALELLIKFVTTPHTFFFREKEHFTILANLIKINSNKTPTIWCAASSTGEEVYSMIITLLEAKITKFVVLASDVNKDVLERMIDGVYNEEKLLNTNKHIISKYFKKIDDYHYRITDKLKKYLVVKRINLIDNFTFEQKIDYIFCRNVMIYFDLETKKKVVDNLLANLKDDGFLFLGHSENLFNITDRVESVFVSVYNKKEEL